MNCIIIAFIVLFILYLSHNTKDHYENVIPYDATKQCTGNYLLNGICYPDMRTCVNSCPTFAPKDMKKNNYCIDNDGTAICYPSTW